MALRQLLRVGPMEEHCCSGGGKNGDGKDQPHLRDPHNPLGSTCDSSPSFSLSGITLSDLGNHKDQAISPCLVKEEMKSRVEASLPIILPRSVWWRGEMELSWASFVLPPPLHTNRHHTSGTRTMGHVYFRGEREEQRG